MLISYTFEQAYEKCRLLTKQEDNWLRYAVKNKEKEQKEKEQEEEKDEIPDRIIYPDTNKNIFYV